MTLFDPGEPVAPEPEPALSIDQRRTRRRRQLLEQGVHPTTKLPLLDPADEARCGNCTHLRRHHRTKTYWKCAEAPGGMTGGPATDVRLSWPACQKWEAANEGDQS